MRGFAVFLAVMGLGVTLAAAPVLAQGYEGLFAPEDTAPARNQPAPAQNPGYQGLIPGAVPAAPAPTPPTTSSRPANATAPATQKSIPRPIRLPEGTLKAQSPAPSTPIPATSNLQPIRSSADLVSLARAYNLAEGSADIGDELAARARLPASSTELLKHPRARINGMLPMENSIKNSIDATMASLRAPNLRPEDRAARAKLAVDSLTTIKRGLTVKSGISDRTYQAMGIPSLYVKEEREALKNALARVDAALAQLQ